MITHCPVCGKMTVIHWPEHWNQRRGDVFYCSWNCYDVSITQDMKLLQLVQQKRRGKTMARMKKDGTPAKKPGRKPRMIETPEGEFAPAKVKVDGPLLIQTETPEQVKVEIPEAKETEFETTAVRNKNLGEFYYDHDHNSIDWRNGLGDEVSLSPAGWKMMIEMLPKIMKKLGVKV